MSGSAVPLSVGTASDCPRLFRKHYDRHRTDLGNRCRYVGVSFRKSIWFHGRAAALATTKAPKKVKSTRISRAGVYLKPLLVQVAIQPFTANADKLSAAGALEIRCQICDGRFLSMWAALFIFLGCPLPPCPKNLHVHNGRIVILASVAWIF